MKCTYSMMRMILEIFGCFVFFCNFILIYVNINCSVMVVVTETARLKASTVSSGISFFL